MTYTYDPTTSIGKMRMIIQDKDEQNVFFQDEELQAFLDMASDVRRAAADALESMASNQVMVLKVVRTLSLSTDGAATARALREHAKILRDQADLADAGDGGLFEIAEFAGDVFTQRERIWNQMLRGEL
ncbi:MAG: hypothetical protein CVU44_21025 [Chloroflexi bacterium HGW-Chloroflexi-6]|nr:MAG: hypothetical protein CVU44_21025 [Chloroflexi bacterium HGW-Chloroflexi-6]